MYSPTKKTFLYTEGISSSRKRDLVFMKRGVGAVVGYNYSKQKSLNKGSFLQLCSHFKVTSFSLVKSDKILAPELGFEPRNP